MEFSAAAAERAAAYFAAKLVLPLFAESAPGFYSVGVAVLYVVFSVLLLYNEAQIFGCFRQITYK